jgi:hypothetical protein
MEVLNSLENSPLNGVGFNLTLKIDGRGAQHKGGGSPLL